MAITLGQKPQPGFDQPIHLMMDCHRRVEHFLGVLVAVADRYDGQALDPSGVKALEVSLHYFKEAAPRHTADEEHSLFPRMREARDDRVAGLMQDVDRLEADHRTAQPMHDRVDELGRRWLSDGRLEGGDLEELRRLLLDMEEIYRAHIALEDSRVFPLAQEVLADEQLSDIGREMAARRRPRGV